MDVSDVVELRVHGVSGTPPQDLLDRPLVTRVAGDGIAGFYRPRLAAESTDTPAGSPSTPGAPLEGYVWGGLTSGSPSRALWLVLLPFTLVNVAPRLRPPDPQGGDADPRTRRRVVLLWYLARLLALSLTMTLTVAFAGIGVDLLGWQCASANRPCRNGSPGWLIGSISGLSTGPRLAVGALVPLLVLAALSGISGGTISRYEAAGARIDSTDDARAPEPGLGSAWMWRGEYLARRLRHLHLQVGLAVVLASVAWPIESAWRIVVLLVAAAATVEVVVLLAIPSVVGRNDRTSWWRPLVWGTWGVLGAVAVITAVLFLTSAVSFTQRSAPEFPIRTTGLPHYAGTLIWFFAVQLVLVAVLAGLIWAMRSTARYPGGQPPGPRPGIAGTGTLVLTLFGVFLGAVFSAGAYLYAAAWLHTGSLKPSFREARDVAYAFDVPETIRDASLTFALSVAILVIVLVALVAVGGVRYLKVTPRAGRVGAQFTADYPDQADTTSSRGRSIVRSFWRADLVDLGGQVVGLLLVPGTVITVAITAMLLARPWSSWAAHQADVLTGKVGDGWLPRTGAFSAANLQGVGAYLVVLLLVLLIAIGAAAFRVPKTRRVVGILWDLASFWPRSAHPLAAPCYAERSVPDLETRIRWYVEGIEPTDYPTGAVVLAGHSQGTVISAAVLRQLQTSDAGVPPPHRIVPRVAFLSYGCVLRRLYGRYFPAYFGPRALDQLAQLLRCDDGSPMRWRNLWRHSDPIGGAVASGPPGTGPDDQGEIAHADRRLVDPRYDRPAGDTSYPPVSGHSNFPADPTFQATVTELAATLPPPPGAAAAPEPARA